MIFHITMAVDKKLDAELNMYKSEYERTLKMLKTDCERCNNVHSNGNKVVLFVGAGINGTDLLWDSIIKDPLDKAIKRFCHEHEIGEIEPNEKELTNTMQASIVKHISKTAYINQLRDFIYRVGPTKNTIRKLIESNGNSDEKLFTLYSLAKIIVENENVVSIVTQNYDKFLTYAISEYANQHGVQIECEEIFGKSYGNDKDARWRYMSGYSCEANNGKRVLPILHVHGYLPPYDELQKKLTGDEIVMSEDEFYTLAKDSFSWMNATQLHYLNHFTCVFAGLSLTDLTLQRLLHFVNKSGDLTHNKYFLTSYPLKKGDDIKNIRWIYLKSSINKELGLTTIFSVEGYHKLFEDITKCMINIK